jgi:hypothetical protein
MAEPGFPVPALRLIAWVLLGTLVVATVAYWGPWVDHRTAALTLSGQDLGEFVKFLPSIRRGAERFPRQLFYLPPFATSCALVLLSSARYVPYPRWLRVLLLAWAALLLLGLLPPAWGRVRDLFVPEFRAQGLALVAGALLVAAHGLVRRLPLAAAAPLLAAIALAALVPAQTAFWIIRPRIWAIYATPTVRLGWGVWLHLAAWLVALLAVCTAWLVTRRTTVNRGS